LCQRCAQGPIHCAATIVREEGPRGLWSGASPTVLRNGTNQMCLFWAKNHMDGAKSPAQHHVACRRGANAGTDGLAASHVLVAMLHKIALHEESNASYAVSGPAVLARFL